MPHKRYQSPHKGYSRRQHKVLAELAIQEEFEFEFEAQIERMRFGTESITSLMEATDGPPSLAPIGGDPGPTDAPSPQGMTISELMADPTDRDTPPGTEVVHGPGPQAERPVPPELERTPERAAVTRVGRGATLVPDDSGAAPQIERLDRLLAAIRRSR